MSQEPKYKVLSFVCLDNSIECFKGRLFANSVNNDIKRLRLGQNFAQLLRNQGHDSLQKEFYCDFDEESDN